MFNFTRIGFAVRGFVLDALLSLAALLLLVCSPLKLWRAHKRNVAQWEENQRQRALEREQNARWMRRMYGKRHAESVVRVRS